MKSFKQCYLLKSFQFYQKMQPQTPLYEWNINYMKKKTDEFFAPVF